MKKVIYIDTIKLDYPLFVKEEFIPKNAKAISFDTIGNNKVVFESIKRDSANYITLVSKDSGWQKEETLNNILSILDDIEVETTITFDDNTTLKVRPALELEEIIKAEELFENSSWFKVEIALCMI